MDETIGPAAGAHRGYQSPAADFVKHIDRVLHVYYAETMAEGGRLDWTHAADKVRRKHHIEPAWGDEAYADPAALIESPDHASTTGATDRLVGYSVTADTLITVIYLRDNLKVTTAFRANTSYTRRYYEREDDTDEQD